TRRVWNDAWMAPRRHYSTGFWRCCRGYLLGCRMLSSCFVVAAFPALLLFQQPAADGRLLFTAPDDWSKRQPQSSMRVAGVQSPATQGDTEPGELVVYYFGGSGGSVDANIQRWLGQMKQPDGRATTDGAGRDNKTINGPQVSLP